MDEKTNETKLLEYLEVYIKNSHIYLESVHSETLLSVQGQISSMKLVQKFIKDGYKVIDG